MKINVGKGVILRQNANPPKSSRLLIGAVVLYTGCPRRNGQNFGRVFLMLKYTDITQNTYIQFERLRR
jgi:hypothetical protein